MHHTSQCINDNKLNEKAKALCMRLYNAGYSSAKNMKSIEQDFIDLSSNAQAYNLMSNAFYNAFHSPRIIDGETSGWAVGGRGGLAPATHRRHF